MTRRLVLGLTALVAAVVLVGGAVAADTSPGAKKPTATVATGMVTVKQNRKVKLPVRCNRTGKTCKGTLLMRQSGSNKKLGQQAFRIPSGKKRTVTIRLSKGVFQSLVANGKLRTKAQATTKQGKGKPRKATRIVVLRAPDTPCDPAYPTVCILPPPPDLNCGDIAFTDFKVLPPDPHSFDGDGDGVGCVS